MLSHPLGSVQIKIVRYLYAHKQGDESAFRMSRLEFKKKDGLVCSLICTYWFPYSLEL